MKVLVAARDVRVRRALSRLLKLDGHRIVGAADAPRLAEETDTQFDALVRDHLADHPDHLLAAWIAGRRFPTR